MIILQSLIPFSSKQLRFWSDCQGRRIASQVPIKWAHVKYERLYPDLVRFQTSSFYCTDIMGSHIFKDINRESTKKRVSSVRRCELIFHTVRWKVTKPQCLSFDCDTVPHPFV